MKWGGIVVECVKLGGWVKWGGWFECVGWVECGSWVYWEVR